MSATKQLRDAYGFKEVRVVTDAVDVPVDAWADLFDRVEVLSAFDRSKYVVETDGALGHKELRAKFPEKRMVRGELGPGSTLGRAFLTDERSSLVFVLEEWVLL